MLLRKGVYYLLAGRQCCLCAAGAETLAFASASPLGPFLPAGSLGSAAAAQQGFVLVHPDVHGILWSGMRWGSQPLLHEALMYWSLLEFYVKEEGGEASAGSSRAQAFPTVRPLMWEDSFTVTVHTP